MMKNLNLADKIILTFSSCMLVLFSYFLFDDSLLFSKFQNGKTEKVGIIFSIKNDVRHKEVGAFSWLPALKQENLFHKDSLFTGPGSEASIQLTDGSIIHISENSLMTLNFKQGQLQLDLKYGDIVSELSQSSNVQVKTGGKEYELKSEKKGSSLRLTRNRMGKNSVKVVQGSPQVITKNTAEKIKIPTVDKGQLNNKKQETNNTNDVVRPTDLKITLKTPDNFFIRRKNKADTFQTEWEASADLKKIKTMHFLVKIQNQNEQQILIEKETSDSQITVVDPVKEGKYQWKVIAIDDQGKTLAESSSQKLIIFDLHAPQINLPMPNSEFKALTDSVELKSTTPDSTPYFLTQYHWQISLDSKFETVYLEETSNKPETKIAPLAEGSYWVRVQLQKGQNEKSEWSESIPFKSIYLAPQPLRAPVLSQKQYEVVPNLLNAESKLQLGRAPASIPSTTVSWTSPEKVESYSVEFSTDAQFTKNKEILNTKDFKASFQKYKSPVTFVRVASINADGTRSPYSEISKIKIVIPKIKIEPIQSYLETKKDADAKPSGYSAKLNWTPVPFASKYKLQISNSADFATSSTTETHDAKMEFQAKEPGTYYAKVLALDNNGRPITEFSQPEYFKYDFKSALHRPTLIEPKPNLTIFLQKEIEPFVWLEWKTTEKAIKYEIQVSQDDQFKKLILSAHSTSPKYLIKQKIPLGQIFWRVRSIPEDLNFTSEWSETRKFKLNHNELETFEE